MIINFFSLIIKNIILIRSGLWVLLDNGITPITMLIMTPILYTYLGVHLYGLWVFSLAVIAFSPIISMGIPVATTKIVSHKLGEGDKEGAGRAIFLGFSIGCIVITFISSALFLMSTLIVHSFFDKMGDSTQVITSFKLSVVLLAIQGLDSILSSAFYGSHKFSDNAKIEVFMRVFLTIAIGGEAYYYNSIYIILITMVIMHLIKLIVKIIVINTIYPGTCYAEGYYSITEVKNITIIKKIFYISKWQFLVNIGAVCFSAVDKLLIGSILGSSDLSRYNICSTLSQYLFSISRSFLSIIFPKISTNLAKGYTLTSFLTNKKLLILSFVCTMPFILTTPFYSFILTTWINEEFSKNNFMLFIFMQLIYALMAINIPAHYIFLGLGNIRKLALINLSGSLLGLITTYIFISSGLVSFAYGKFAYAIVISTLFISIYWKLKNDKNK